MKISTDVLCTSSIFLGSNRLVSCFVSFLVYVQSELKPIDLIFSSLQSGEERRGEERRGEERRGEERSREGVEEQRGLERSGVERRGAKRRQEEPR